MFLKLRLNLALKTALLWVVVGRCGSLWMVVGRFGSFWVVPRFSNYDGRIDKESAACHLLFRIIDPQTPKR